MDVRRLTKQPCTKVLGWATSLAMLTQLSVAPVQAGQASEAAPREIPLLQRAMAQVEVDGNANTIETLRWEQAGDRYQMILSGSAHSLWKKTGPLFYHPIQAWEGDADHDGQRDLIIVWQEDASGGTMQYWLLRGGVRPSLGYQSEDYPQGSVELREEGLFLTYSVFEPGDANAFPSRRVEERWGNRNWRMLAKKTVDNRKTRLSAQAGSNKNPPMYEIEEMLEDVAQKYGIPPALLKAIAWQESTWRQFDANGNPLISFDGGIGIMQLTNQWSYDQQRLKTDIRYNIEAGAQVLLDKRSYTKSLLPAIGSMDKDEMESWYFAVWAYNGWSMYNNPHNIPNKFRKTAAYQDNVYAFAHDYFGQTITKIPKALIPATTVPSGRTSYKTPLPIHVTGEDTRRRDIQVGDTVEVSGLTQSLNVRQSGGLSGRVIGSMKTKERGVVLKGPSERDGYEWYQLKYKNGTGWAAGHYMVAVLDERVSLAEVLENDAASLQENARKADGRNLYLQAGDLTMPWQSVLDNGGLAAALKTYQWNELWLERTSSTRKENKPSKTGTGWLEELSPAWNEQNVALTAPITLQVDADDTVPVKESEFTLVNSKGKTLSVKVSHTGRQTETWTIKPERSWEKGETYTLFYRNLPLTRFTAGTGKGASLDGFEMYEPAGNEISIYKTIEIGFSKAMDAKTVTSKHVWLEDESGKRVETTLSLSKDKRSLFVNPRKSLKSGSIYYVKMTTGLRSTAGVPMKKNMAYLFQTKR
ncbi:Ig-like domain-containing protein [Brevibacillus migulae]|uniref:Ig-like domain-containing protein n=1 Tax=Brevibacillus migulae TaxID=1644114 RepID=UPI00106EE08E|nr:Ig-like domain-containing protein [Brevibacillus migulae]